MVSSCSVCSRAARHQCPQCATLYCGASCYIQTKAQHALICGQEKRQRDEETSKEDFIQLIEANDIEGVERAIKDVPTDYILMHYAKTPEMARLLVMHGGDVYAYVENGMVALDYMVRYMNIREFMAEATVPVPEWLADMIKRAQRDMASEPKRKHVYEITAQNPTLDDLRLAVFHGFVIVDESEYFLMCEHLLYRRYDNDSLVFWFGAGYTNFLYWISSFPFYYVNIGRIVEEAAHSASSFALLLFAPEHVYRQSKRPVNRMELFQMADSRILHVRLNVSDQFIPVTRYAKTREAGLFFGARGDRDFCGTFYYYEPESTTFLRAQNVLRAKNKTEAMSILTGGNFIQKIWRSCENPTLSRVAFFCSIHLS